MCRYALVEMLAHRMAVGVISGATVAGTRAAHTRQVAILGAVFLAHIGFLAAYRPFIVPIANFFEGLLACFQLSCVLLNFWLLAPGCTVLGLRLSAGDVEQAMDGLMAVAVITMALRTAVVCVRTVPTRISR